VHEQLATIGATCLNCGAELAGPFCSGCGQKAVHPKPTLHELLHDALEEFLHFDGKIVQTLRTLVTKPGQLTLDVVAGRRARYIAPLRLYLTISVLFFVVAAVTPTRGITVTVTDPGKGVGASVQNTKRPMTDEEKRKFLEDNEKQAPRFLQPLIHRVIQDPVGLTRDVFATWPKAMFVLLPVFAVIVAAFFHRRHFVEHLYFALHVHAFAFLVTAVNSTIGLAHIRWVSIPLGIVVMIWVPLYVHFAFKRVYGGSHVLTLAKEAGVAVLYGIAMVPAIFVAALWVAAHPR